MTPAEALSCLTELRALERLHAVVSRMPAPSVEWRAGLTAIADRIRWVRVSLSREDQALLDRVEAIYQHERRLELFDKCTYQPGPDAPTVTLKLQPQGVRIH